MYYTSENFTELENISHEILADFQIYHDLLIKWQRAVNLISPNTIDEIWHRHFADSVGLYNHIPSSVKTIADVGSGGGLPAIVCAIIAKGRNQDLHITMIESDNKKCMFLKECIRILKLNATVINDRIENVKGEQFDLMTARALADFTTLLFMADSLSIKSALLQKGEKWEGEINNASQKYSFQYTHHVSITNENAKLIHITQFEKI